MRVDQTMKKFARRLRRQFWRPLRWGAARLAFRLFGICGLTGQTIADQPTLGPFESPAPGELRIPLGDEHFDPIQALHGSFCSRERCALVPNGLWIEVDGRGDCVRYYVAGSFEGSPQSVLVYIGGDVMLRTSKGVKHIAATYVASSPMKVEQDMADWAVEAQAPAIFLARAGLYGSSGDHNKRRHLREIELLDRALNALKELYGIGSFILAGHSGGGQIAATLLNRRSDIAAMVVSSGLLSVKQVTAFWEHRQEIPGRLMYEAKRYCDPIDGLGGIRRDLLPQIYVISDPEDRIVPFFSQLYYVRRLRAMGLRPVHIYAHAPGAQRHLLAAQAKRAAALVARGLSETEIRRAVHELDASDH